MFFIRHTFSSIVLLVLFLILTVVAVLLYSSSPEEKSEVDGQFFWQKIKSSWHQNEDSKKIEEDESFFDFNSEKAGTWQSMKNRLKSEWENTGDNHEVLSDQLKFELEKIDSGAVMIFRTNIGREYRLPLPYKFWRLIF